MCWHWSRLSGKQRRCSSSGICLRRFPWHKIKILTQTSNSSYKTGNDIEVEEEGTVKKAVSPATPEEENVIAVKGRYSYKADDGTLIELIYTADDETGFVPQGAHLPTAPPIPEAIQKALAYIASQPSTPEPARG